MKNYIFTLIIVLVVIITLIFPQYFIQINGFPLKKLIVPLLQLIMFGMGTTMTWQDFGEVVKMPKAVIIGLICQFTIMPTVGFLLANSFSFEAEIAAGIILIGCSPSGLASNVMAYLAKANVPLSITITSFATLLAPILTPALMKLLGGQFITISFWAMMWDILLMIIFPLFLGLLLNYLLPKVVLRLKNFLPLVSMFGIAFIIAIITASGRNALLNIGGLLILVVLMHNLLGFLFGYWGGKLFRLPEQDCRTIAIEVGLQNGGLASGLALQMGKEATVGLAAALFGPIMNTTGSLLATWWGKRPVSTPPKNDSQPL
jgi:BASS family bile acid:Na+ symporter